MKWNRQADVGVRRGRPRERGRSATAVAVYLTVAGCLCAGALAANLTRSSRQSPPARAAVAPGGAATHGNDAAARTPLLSAAAGAGRIPAGASAKPARLDMAVTTLPASGVVSEPSIAIDSTGSIFVTAPTKIGHDASISASPLWKSTDAGATWVGPTSTETGGQTATGLGGGDSDIVIGPGDTVYVASLWLGNSAMAVSTDNGGSFTELPIGHVTPLDDRPWLYYDPASNALYMAWDGAGALHVGKALLGAQFQQQAIPGAGPQGQLVFEQDVPAVPNEPDRGCGTCPPGTIVVDPSGAISVAFTGPSGVGVATSTDGGLTWPQSSQSFVPTTAGTSDANIFEMLRGDSEGNLYLVWTQLVGSGNTPQVFLSYRRAGGSSWHAPIKVSTPPDALFGTVAVVSPGTVDVAYYGSSYAGDPNAAPASTSWDLHLAKVQNLFGTPTTTTADVLPGFHHGSISTGGLSSTLAGAPADRRLGDFFSMTVDHAGLADIVTAVDDGNGTKLQFLHELPPPPPPTPGPVFVLPPAPGAPTAAGPYRPPGFVAAGAVASVGGAAATPDPASGNAAGGAVIPAAGNANTTGSTGPKYPDGVGVATPDTPGGSPGRGPSWWVYGLAGAGATAGRFALRRGR